MVSAEIPVKPYVKVYLEQTFGNPLKMNRRTIIGKFFYSLLDNHSERREKECQEYNAFVTVKITEDVFFRKGYILSKTSLREFNTFVEQDILTKLYTEIENLIDHQNYLIKDAIYSSLEKYRLTPDCLSYETIRKNYYRQRKRNENSVGIMNKGKRTRVN